MFAESYTKFYVFMALALLLGFIGMETATTGISLKEGQLTGQATQSISSASSLTGSASPGSNLVFLLIGVVAGAVIVGTAVYIYSVERKRYD